MKQHRRASVASLLTGAIIGASLLMASPAQANATATATCRANSTTNLTLFVGQTLTIETSDQCRRIEGSDGGLGGTGTLTYIASNGETTTYPIGTGGTPGLKVPSTVIYTGTVVGGAQVNIRAAGSVIQAWVVTVTEAPAPEPTTSISGGAPAPVLQQFGRPDVGSCDDVAPGTLDWSGVTSGGWSESWAQWVNNGNGGAVCTRTLTYHAGQFTPTPN